MKYQNLKPKQTAQQLITKMKFDKGISFNYISEIEAENYLKNINNYFRTASYRKNYPKYTKGINEGKYIHLDFAYLQELSTLDMHLRFIISKMCLDIEHDLKVQMLKDIESDISTDGYSIVNDFLSHNTYIIKKLEASSAAPFTSDLINKYFSVQRISNPTNQKMKNKIVFYDDCPVWVLLELLTFGDFIRLYEFYYSSRTFFKISTSVINLVKSLRNAVAHNNCILSNLKHGTAKAPPEISQAISKIDTIKSNQRKKKLSCRPMLEFTCLLYTYKHIVSDNIKYYRSNELKNLFFNRMITRKEFFQNNELILSNYQFACKIISTFF